MAALSLGGSDSKGDEMEWRRGMTEMDGGGTKAKGNVSEGGGCGGNPSPMCAFEGAEVREMARGQGK